MTHTSALTHLAIIPDGNRRWAKQHGIGSEKQVYEQGSETTFEIIKAAFEAGIPYVTFWASSSANLLARPKALVGAIELIYARKFRELATHPLIHEHQVHVDVRGEWEKLLKSSTVKAMKEAMQATAHYARRRLTVLVGYDGRHELGAAALALLQNPEREAITTPEEAGMELRAQAWTGHLPDVDLIIRTGAWQDPHNSASFLSLLTAESQFAFPEVLWPDFNAQMFQEIIDDYTVRERRMGK